MSTKGGKYRNHHFHGDPNRFEILAHYIGGKYAGHVKRVADVAGGQGMLARILTKKYNFEVDVIDPRGHPLVGVHNRAEEYTADMAEFYDLIVGLHPDQATKDIVYSALVRPTLIIPCCNFWDKSKSLGRDALLEEIEKFYQENQISYERIVFDFEGPKNIGLISYPTIKE